MTIPKAKVALIIIHFSGIAETLDCLESLKKADLTNLELNLILVDNSENSDLEFKLTSYSPKVNYLKFPQNLGFSQGTNKGLEEALKIGAQYIILLNSDTTLPPDLLIRLVKFANLNKQYGLISPKIYFAPGYEYQKNRYKNREKGRVIWYAGGKIDWDNIFPKHIGVDEVDKKQFDQLKEVDFVTGCCILIRKEVVNKVGLFDKNYFVYFEDVDYSVRAIKLGFKICYLPDTFIWHKNASSSGKPGSLLHVYFQTRNRFYFGLKYASLKTKFHLLKEAIKFALSSDIAKQNGAKDFLFGNMGKGSLALFIKD